MRLGSLQLSGTGRMPRLLLGALGPSAFPDTVPASGQRGVLVLGEIHRFQPVSTVFRCDLETRDLPSYRTVL